MRCPRSALGSRPLPLSKKNGKRRFRAPVTPTGRRRIPLVARSRSGRPIGSARGWGGLMGDQSSGRGRGVDVVSRSERTGGASGRLRLRRRAPRGLWWLPSYRRMRPDLEGTAVSGWLTRSAQKKAWFLRYGPGPLSEEHGQPRVCVRAARASAKHLACQGIRSPHPETSASSGRPGSRGW